MIVVVGATNGLAWCTILTISNASSLSILLAIGLIASFIFFTVLQLSVVR